MRCALAVLAIHVAIIAFLLDNVLPWACECNIMATAAEETRLFILPLLRLTIRQIVVTDCCDGELVAVVAVERTVEKSSKEKRSVLWPGAFSYALAVGRCYGFAGVI